MSDAYTEIARDEERYKRMIEHLRALKNCLEFSGDSGKFLDLHNRALDTAEACDALQGTGYWTQETNIAEGIREQIAGLLAFDTNAWTKFLATLQGDYLVEFKKLSPFKDTPATS